MKHLIIITMFVGMAACTQAPQPIYDADIYIPGKAGTLVQTSSRPEPNPCWNRWGQHNNLPGCPWFAEGGGDMEHLRNDRKNPAGGSDIPADTPDTGGDSEPPVDSGEPVDDTITTKYPDGIFYDTITTKYPDGIFFPSQAGGNPGNDKPVGNAGENPNGKGGWGTGDKGVSK